MNKPGIRFDDGAAYEDFMGKWSRLAGDTFLDWLAPPAGWRWADIGWGNGAFTEMLVERCAPASVDGIDPSEGQLAFARTRPAARVAQFRLGALALDELTDLAADGSQHVEQLPIGLPDLATEKLDHAQDFPPEQDGKAKGRV